MRQLKVKTIKLHKARENAGEQGKIGCSFDSDWYMLKGPREPSELSKASLMQSRITVNNPSENLSQMRDGLPYLGSVAPCRDFIDKLFLIPLLLDSLSPSKLHF